MNKSKCKNKHDNNDSIDNNNNIGDDNLEDNVIDNNINELIQERNKARAEKDWTKADEVRKKLDNSGIILEDTPEGTIWKKK